MDKKLTKKAFMLGQNALRLILFQWFWIFEADVKGKECEVTFDHSSHPDASIPGPLSALYCRENLTEIAYNMSIQDASPFLTLGEANHVSMGQNTLAPRMNTVVYTQEGTGKQLFVHVIQWGHISSTNPLYYFPTALSDIIVPENATEVRFEIKSTIDHNYHPVSLQAPVPAEIASYQIRKKFGSIDMAECVIYLNQNINQDFNITLVQQDSGNTVTCELRIAN